MIACFWRVFVGKVAEIGLKDVGKTAKIGSKHVGKVAKIGLKHVGKTAKIGLKCVGKTANMVMFIERHDEAPTHYKVDLTGLE